MNKFVGVPISRLGKCAVWLLCAFFISLILFNLMMRMNASFLLMDEQPPIRFIYFLPLAGAGVCGIGAFITGLISLIWIRERSILVILATLVGAFVLFFVIEEITILL